MSEAYELENQSIELGDDPRAVLVGMQIEFMREGHAKVTITISRRLVEQAKALDMTT